ncbi:polyadenylate-binding protein-interacting protein 4 isoform X2 [Aristolochia californica]|uniref:polyadenylate-binding protein-interacting protein 4 isoform X2 n=1 Tax=Aristolochia californica TaxID=171875 RepID=UPI0035D9D043
MMEMACRSSEHADGTSAPKLSDALLFTTMCIIGLPVEVQVKDGAIYSGIFHTACVEEDYGIVLKKARRTQRGENGSTNLKEGALIDTLVVLSEDLVQVVAKGLFFPGDGVVSNAAGDVLVASGHGQQGTGLHQIEGEPSKAFEILAVEGSHIGEIRSLDQIEDTNAANSNYKDGFLTKGEVALDMIEGEVSDSKCNVTLIKETGKEEASSNQKAETMLCEVACCTSTSNTCLVDKQPEDEPHVELSSKISFNEETCTSHVHSAIAPEGQHIDTHNFSDSPPAESITANASSSSNSAMNVNSSSCTSPLSSANGLVSSVFKSNAKEFKLNPGAKTFSPSSAYSRLAPMSASTTANIGYVTNNTPGGAVATTQPGVEVSSFASRSSLPVKFVQYNNMMAGSVGTGSQYGLPIVGHVGSRQQPVRYSGQYPAGPAYLPPNHPNSQTVMLGRLGQVVYVHPISHDAIQGAPALSQGPGCHLLGTPHQPHLPKHQGRVTPALQLCMTPPLVAGGQQSIALPAQLPFSQSIPAIRPVPVVPSITSVFGGVPLVL